MTPPSHDPPATPSASARVPEESPDRPRRRVTRPPTPLLVIVGAVLAVRLALMAYMAAADPERFIMIDGDSDRYEQLALSIVQDGTFTDTDGQPAFLRTPGYPAFIAAIYAVVGPYPVAVIAVQVLLSVLALFVVYRITEILFSPQAGLFAVAIMALDPLHTYLALIMMTDSLGTLLAVLAALLAVWLLTGRTSPWLAFACGLTLAVSTLVRPISYYLIWAVALGFIILHRSAGWSARKLTLAVVAFLVPAIVIVGGWQLRNSHAVGTAKFSGITGRNMLHYRAAALYALHEDVSRKTAVEVLTEQMLAETDSTKHLHDRQMEYAVRYLLDDIPGSLRLGVFGTARLMLDPGGGETLKLFGYRQVAGTKSMANSMSASFGTYLERWAGGRGWVVGVIVLSVVFLGAFYLASLLGFVRWLRGPRSHLAAHLLILGMIAYYVAVSAGAEALARFRSPFAPLLAVYAGAGLAWLAGRWRPRRAAGTGQPWRRSGSRPRRAARPAAS